MFKLFREKKKSPEEAAKRAEELLAVAKLQSNGELLDSLEEYMGLMGILSENPNYTPDRAYDLIAHKCLGIITSNYSTHFILQTYERTNRVVAPTEKLDLDAVVKSSLHPFEEISGGSLDLTRVKEKLTKAIVGNQENWKNDYIRLLLNLSYQAFQHQLNPNMSFDRLLADYEANLETYHKFVSQDIPAFPEEVGKIGGKSTARVAYISALNNTFMHINNASVAAEDETGNPFHRQSLVNVCSNAFENQIRLARRYSSYKNDFDAQEIAEISTKLEEQLAIRESYLPKAKEIVEQIHDSIFENVNTLQNPLDKIKALAQLLKLSLSHSHILELDSLDSMIEYGNSELQKIGGKVYWDGKINQSNKMQLCAEYEEQKYSLGIERSKNPPPTDKDEWEKFFMLNRD